MVEEEYLICYIYAREKVLSWCIHFFIIVCSIETVMEKLYSDGIGLSPLGRNNLYHHGYQIKAKAPLNTRLKPFLHEYQTIKPYLQ